MALDSKWVTPGYLLGLDVAISHVGDNKVVYVEILPNFRFLVAP